jgi:2'-5' RNA ligase
MTGPDPAGRRLFIALDLPADVQRRLARIVAAAPNGVRPTPAGQMHLTLHFLGSVAGERAAAVRGGLGSVRGQPLVLDIEGLGCFPPRGRPSVLWAGVAPNAALADLHARLAEVIGKAGLPIERRPFTAHVTLARLGPRVPVTWVAERLARGGAVALPGIPIDRFVLYASRLEPGGAVHVAEAVFPLEAPPSSAPPAADDAGRGPRHRP